MWKPKVYLAGGFKTEWQKELKKKCGDIFEFFDPAENDLGSISYLYTAWDLHHVKHCDIIFAYIEKGNPGGFAMCLEVGVGKGLGKTVILVDEKSMEDETFARYFKMLRISSDACFDDFEEGIDYLKKFGKNE